MTSAEFRDPFSLRSIELHCIGFHWEMFRVLKQLKLYRQHLCLVVNNHNLNSSLSLKQTNKNSTVMH